MLKTWIGAGAAILITGCVLAEGAARLSGATSVPLYVKDSVDQYRPAANQHGALWRRNDWVYNDRGMGVGPPFQPIGSLVIGDSETEGSVSFMKQADKIGPLLQKDTGDEVWPLGAKGWGLANELGWLNAHSEVFALKRIMILSNRGDFGPAHAWDDEIAHPTHRPLLATAYLVRKAFYKPDPTTDDPLPSPESTRSWHDALHRFLTSYQGQVVFIELPIESDVINHRDGFAPLNDELKVEGRANLYVIRVADDPTWNAGLYHNEFHPSPAGNRELAAFIAHHLPALN